MRRKALAGIAILAIILGAIWAVATWWWPARVAKTASTATNPVAQAHAGKAAKLLEDKHYQEAAAEFEQALASAPNDDTVRLQYATCLFLQERNAESRKQFEIVRGHLGEKPGIDYFLAQLDLRANDFAQAIRRLQPLEKERKFPKASFYLGLAYLAAGQKAKALEALTLAAANNPDDPEVHYRLARFYTMTGRDQDADHEYRIYRDTQQTQQVVEEEGHACKDALATQGIEEARTVCEKIAAPDSAGRMLLLGRLYAESKAYGDAVEPLRAATKLAPTSFDAWHYLGLSLYRLHRYQEALPAVQKAQELHPEYYDTMYLLAATLYAVGDRRAALPALERAHELNPNDEKVNAALARMRAELGAKQ